MRFEYEGSAKESVESIFVDVFEFEYQVKRSVATNQVDEIRVELLTPGLSGAVVFLIRPLGPLGSFTPWVAKAALDARLIAKERDVNERLVKNRIPAAPLMADTGSARLILFSFSGPLANYNPKTLREGYSSSSPEALEVLMRRIVTSLQPINKLSEDTATLVDRMPALRRLANDPPGCIESIPRGQWAEFISAWDRVKSQKQSIRRVRTSAHGDLNAGNVLFVPGDSASIPVFIDFASMERSKDNVDYPDGYHIPFWDFAKLERDIVTRLFIKDAQAENLLDEEDLISFAVDIFSGKNSLPIRAESLAIERFKRAITALRDAVRQINAPDVYHSCYKISLAYSLLSVLYREKSDCDVPASVQHMVAVKGAIAILEDPFRYPDVTNYEKKK